MVDLSRRIYPRRSSNLETRVLDATGTYHRGVLRNISVGGALLVLQAALPVGSRVTVEFQIGDAPLTRCGADVMWLKPDSGPEHTMGIRFAEMSFDNACRLAEFVEQGM